MNRNEISMVLAERIGKLRADAGESQQQLADALEVKRETVKFWESGERQIKGADIVALAKHFNVSADYLLGLTDPQTKDYDLRFVCEYTGLSEHSVRNIRAGRHELREKDLSPIEYNHFEYDVVDLLPEENDNEADEDESLSFIDRLEQTLHVESKHRDRLDIFNALLNTPDFLIQVLSPLEFALGYKETGEQLLTEDFTNFSSTEVDGIATFQNDLIRNLKFELYDAVEGFRKIVNKTFNFDSVIDGLDKQFSYLLKLIDKKMDEEWAKEHHSELFTDSVEGDNGEYKED